MTIGFLIAAVLVVGGAIAATLLRNLVHCALALAGTFAGLAAVYLSLGAEFIGFAQLLVYAGAVAILVIFAILLTGSRLEEGSRWSRGWGWGMAVCAGLFALLCWAIFSNPSPSRQTAAPELTVKSIGDQLMGRYLLPLEILGLLLTAALIGAVVLAMRDQEDA